MIPIKNNVNPIVSWIKWRIKKNKNAIIVINGPTGSGKTYCGLNLAEDVGKELNTPFSVENNVDFKFTELLRKTMQPGNKKAGTVFLFEEVGAMGGGASSREWQGELNKMFFSFMQTTRHRRQVLIMTCPSFSFLEKGARTLVHMQIEMQNIDFNTKIAYAKPYVIQVNPRTSKFYYKFLRMRGGMGAIRLNRVGFNLPSKNITATYELAKTNFTDNLNKLALSDKKDGKKGRSPVVLVIDVLRDIKDGLTHFKIANKRGICTKTVQGIVQKHNADKKPEKEWIYSKINETEGQIEGTPPPLGGSGGIIAPI